MLQPPRSRFLLSPTRHCIHYVGQARRSCRARLAVTNSCGIEETAATPESLVSSSPFISNAYLHLLPRAGYCGRMQTQYSADSSTCRGVCIQPTLLCRPCREVTSDSVFLFCTILGHSSSRKQELVISFHARRLTGSRSADLSPASKSHPT